MEDRCLARAALAALIVLQAIMLVSLFAGLSPHPPAATPLFGMAPFLAASMAVAVAAIILGPTTHLFGRSLSAIAIICALVSFGPQKYVDPNFHLIWPAILVAQAASIVLIGVVVRGYVVGRRTRRNPA